MRVGKVHMLAAAACLYLAALVFYGLDVFPGLHGDEAWVGLYAQRVKLRGLYSPHEMNTYTGPFYGWVIARWFAGFGVSVFNLRLTGAILNLLAAFAMLVHLARKFGAGSMAAWLYLLVSSAMFLHASRVAWEVCALEVFLLTAIYLSSCGMLEKKRYSFVSVAVFLAANYFGAWTHFIILSVPLSLAVLAFYGSFFYNDRRQARFFQLTVYNLLIVGLVFLVKPRWTDSFWSAHKEVLVPLVLGAPFLAAAMFESFARATSGFVEGSLPDSWHKSLRNLFLLGIFIFFVFHLAPLVQIWSNVIIFKRLASWCPPLWMSAVLYLWAGMMLGACFFFAFRHASKAEMERLTSYERFVVFWPVAYAVIYILFRHTSSIRYYIIPSFLFMAAAAYVLPRTILFRRPKVLTAGGLVAVLLNACYWSELLSPGVRPPIRFRIGWRGEKSHDFMKKDPVYAVMEREKICRLDQDESMLDIPIMFQAHVRPHACDETKSIGVRYCTECLQPPYFDWTIR